MNDVTKLRIYGWTTLLVLLLIVIVAVPARATECVTYDFETRTVSGSGRVDVSWVTQDVDQYLWVSVGELDPDADLGVGVVSHQIPEDAISALVCEDGSVTFTQADPMSVGEVVDVTVPDEIADALVLTSEIPYAPQMARVSG